MFCFVASLVGYDEKMSGCISVYQTGSLRVNITPSAAVSGGAQWRVNSGSWKYSGSRVSVLSLGNRTFSLKSIHGWKTPSNIIESISEGKNTE